jgi:hypothetical protein
MRAIRASSSATLARWLPRHMEYLSQCDHRGCRRSISWRSQPSSTVS